MKKWIVNSFLAIGPFCHLPFWIRAHTVRSLHKLQMLHLDKRDLGEGTHFPLIDSIFRPRKPYWEASQEIPLHVLLARHSKPIPGEELLYPSSPVGRLRVIIFPQSVGAAWRRGGHLYRVRILTWGENRQEMLRGGPRCLLQKVCIIELPASR